MSMLSAQCDELREVAYKVDEYQMGRERVPLKTAAIMREAADTILSLRDRAQDLQAMNAKLRKERDMYRDLVGMMDHPDLNAQLKAENAKLRELAGELWFYAEQELVCDDNCPYGAACDWMEPTVVCVFKRRMRELGVEVD